jgi:lipopolysaccharide/colanic/teichoic acid biosynthesis glycosyltransferase
MRALAAADTLGLIAAFLLAYAVRASFDGAIQPLDFYLPFLGASLALFLLGALLFSLYVPGRALFSLSYLTDFLRAFTLFAFALLAFSFFTKTDYSRIVVLAYIVGAFATLYTLRFLFAWLMREEGRRDTEVTRAARSILSIVSVAPDPLTFLETVRMERAGNIVERTAKRLFDVALALTALAFVLPLFPLIAWRIRRESTGPAFIRQERIGKDGAVFTLYKFRTMHPDAELYAQAPRDDEDPRVTRVGRTLRRYSVDELPQLWNVVRGEMSIVGPRPEMPFIVERYAPWQRARLRVTPGLTGLWQILGRKDLPLSENLEYDLYYLFNRSFFLDCAIILKTLPHLTLPKGAY